jgi:hypothetical protein
LGFSSARNHVFKGITLFSAFSITYPANKFTATHFYNLQEIKVAAQNKGRSLIFCFGISPYLSSVKT